MAHLTETYRAKRVFKQHSTAFTDFGSAALPPLAPWTDHLVQNRSVEAAPAPQGALKAFVEALLAKDDVAVRSGQAWFTVPGRLVNRVRAAERASRAARAGLLRVRMVEVVACGGRED